MVKSYNNLYFILFTHGTHDLLRITDSMYVEPNLLLYKNTVNYTLRRHINHTSLTAHVTLNPHFSRKVRS